REALKKNPASFDPIRQHVALRRDTVPEASSLQGVEGGALNLASKKVTEDSWKQEFVGDAHIELKDHIISHWKDKEHYAPYCTIVESTGTGKSRMVDEFSRANFTLTVNLRDPPAQGFPPSDDKVYKYFEPESLGAKTLDELWVHVTAFMLALFEECKKAILTVMEKECSCDNDRKEWLHHKGAVWFRDKMTEGQTMKSQGEYRVNFYNSVVLRAEEVVVDSALAWTVY
ncbi:hypothetical protein EUX98_g8894, partial [Antrodiella citrinella]